MKCELKEICGDWELRIFQNPEQPTVLFFNSRQNALNIFNQLRKEIEYALNSKSRNLAYQAYGAAKMAWRLEAITDEQFYELNDMVIANGINKPSAGLK